MKKFYVSILFKVSKKIGYISHKLMAISDKIDDTARDIEDTLEG